MLFENQIHGRSLPEASGMAEGLLARQRTGMSWPSCHLKYSLFIIIKLVKK